MLTPEKIEELRALLAKATPGPWGQHLVDDTTIIAENGFEIGSTWPDGGIDDDRDFSAPVEQHEINAALIVAMRNALPALLASLAYKDAEIAEAVKDAAYFMRLREQWQQYAEQMERTADATMAAEIQDQRSKNATLNDRAEAAESRLTAALAVLGEAREALEPFAETPEHGSYGGPLVCAIILYEDETDKRAGRYAPRLTSENFRKARAALAKLSAFEENEDERSASNGAGPEGETCKSCAHIHRNQMAKAFLKCSLMCHRWERK